MNEIQIIQSQLATERLHFAEVAETCATAIGNGSFIRGGELARACAEYFAFAVTRLDWNSQTPAADAAVQPWREFLRAFDAVAAKHFAAIDAQLQRNLTVTEWRARSKIDADSIFQERARYQRVKAAAP